MLLPLYLAVESAGETSGSAAVQVALIGALAPVILVILNEMFKRWRHRGDTPGEDRDGVLAPVEEVPRAQFDQLLEQFAELDQRSHEREKAHDLDRHRWLSERRELESEIDRQRRDLLREVEARVRAETLLQAFRGGMDA